MIDNNPVRPTVRVVEVCREPLERRFRFPNVRNVNRHRIENGNDLRTEVLLNTGRFDRPEPDDRKAFLDLGYQLVRGILVYRFQFDYEPERVVVADPGTCPFIGPHALAIVTGISRNQVYLAMDFGVVDTISSDWSGSPRSYVVVNDRLAHWLWGQPCGDFNVSDFRFPTSHALARDADLFSAPRSDHGDLVDAIRTGVVPGHLEDHADDASAVVRSGYQFVSWLAARRTDDSRNRILAAIHG